MATLNERMAKWGETNPWSFGLAQGWIIFVISVPLLVTLGQSFVQSLLHTAFYAFLWATAQGLIYSWRSKRKSGTSD